MGRKADKRHRKHKDWSRSNSSQVSKQSTYLSPWVCSLRNAHTSKLRSTSAHCSAPQSQKNRAVWGNQGTRVVKIAYPDLDWRTSLFEKLQFCSWATTVQGSPGVTSCERPLPASQRTQQCQSPTGSCHSHVHHNLVSNLPQFHPCPPETRCSLLKAVGTTIQTMHLWMFLWGSPEERQFSNGQEVVLQGRSIALALHKPWVRTQEKIDSLWPAHVSSGLQSTK